MTYSPQKSISALIKKAGCLFVRLTNQYLKECDVPQSYCGFLVHLWQEDGQTQATLHRKIGIEQPTAVRTLDCMERDKLIKKVRSKSDRREIKIYLTEKGKELQPAVISCAIKMNKKATQGISEQEKQTLCLLLETIIENLEKNITIEKE